MAVSTFGIGTPVSLAAQIPLASAPFGLQGLSNNPYAAQQLYGQAVIGPSATQPLQQIFQFLQVVPQQLQQLHQLVFVQQQQLQQIQQLLQLIPGQLVQLQQVVQSLPQQLQQSSASLPGLTGYGPTTSWGITPYVYAQPGQVM